MALKTHQYDKIKDMPDSIDPKRVAFAIITSYPQWYQGPLRSIKHTDKVRGDLALEFFQKLSEKGCRVICSDGKSPKSFQKILSTFPNLTLVKRKTNSSGHAKREAIRKAIKLDGAEVIVLTEAEKVSIVTDCLDLIVQPILENKADIVVPKREEKLFKLTYPGYMYQSEIEANRLFNEGLRSNGILSNKYPEFDHFFGPRAFRNDKKIVALFMRRYIFVGASIVSSLFDPERYSNVQFFPVVTALKKQMRVAEVIVPFRYPKIQRDNEEVGDREAFINKRNFQRINILVDLMHLLNFLQKKKSTSLRLNHP